MQSGPPTPRKGAQHTTPAQVHKKGPLLPPSHPSRPKGSPPPYPRGGGEAERGSPAPSQFRARRGPWKTRAHRVLPKAGQEAHTGNITGYLRKKDILRITPPSPPPPHRGRREEPSSHTSSRRDPSPRTPHPPEPLPTPRPPPSAGRTAPRPRTQLRLQAARIACAKNRLP